MAGARAGPPEIERDGAGECTHSPEAQIPKGTGCNHDGIIYSLGYNSDPVRIRFWRAKPLKMSPCRCIYSP